MTVALDVVIPMLNARPYIRAAVDSALAQTGADVTVIVVDAGSTDGGADEVRSWEDPRVRLLAGSRPLMAGAARNRGAQHATAEWLGFLDADDVWPHARTMQLLAGATQPQRQILVGHQITFADGVTVDPGARYLPAGHPVGLVVGGVLMSREAFQRVGGFDEDLRIGEFIEWMARCRRLGMDEVHVPAVSLLRRSHATNTSRVRKGDYASGYLDIVRHHLQQRRLHAPGAIDGR